MADEELTEKKSGINPKIFLFGLPLFIIQLLVVYFVTANVLLSKIDAHTADKKTEKAKEKVVPVKTDLGKYIYTVEDVIVNPAGTDGKRLLLSSVGFDLSAEESKQEMKEKEVLVKDLIISILSSKNINQLMNYSYKDSLRIEIAKKMKLKLPEVKVNNIYFSKYIIQ